MLSITAGTLWVVATPLGNLQDLSQRAVETLATAELVAAEDTRRTYQLLSHLGLTTPLISLHEHNESQRIDSLLAHLQAGKSLALVSDGGTPLVNDPGFLLVDQAHQHEIPVRIVPGPSAPIAALAVAGLATDRFRFIGFLPAKTSARRQQLNRLKNEPDTVIAFEACHRIAACLQDCVEILGAARRAALCRELTKRYETVRRASFMDLFTWVSADPQQQKGELTLVIEGQPPLATLDTESERLLRELLRELPASKAAAVAARLTGVPKRTLYRLALALAGDTRH